MPVECGDVLADAESTTLYMWLGLIGWILSSTESSSTWRWATFNWICHLPYDLEGGLFIENQVFAALFEDR